MSQCGHRATAAALTSLRGAYGAALLIRPTPLSRWVTRLRPRPWEPRLARVLGARHLVQALATARNADRATLTLGAEMDVLHVASLATVAVWSPTYRRVACADIAMASVLAVGTIFVARHAHQTRAVGRLPEGVVEGFEDWRNDLARRVVRPTPPALGRRRTDPPMRDQSRMG